MRATPNARRQREGWRQHHVLQAGEALEQISDPEQLRAPVRPQGLTLTGVIRYGLRVTTMTPSEKKQTAFRIEPEILDGLQLLKERDGIPISEQVRRALREWLDRRGVKLKTAPRRATTRRRT
jgi:hypothetical protein